MTKASLASASFPISFQLVTWVEDCDNDDDHGNNNDDGNNRGLYSGLDVLLSPSFKLKQLLFPKYASHSIVRTSQSKMKDMLTLRSLT